MRIGLACLALLRFHQFLMIVSTLLGSWLGMQAVHELGYVMGARLTGGQVAQVVLHPLTISRTDLAQNPYPLVVVWAGPVLGALLPLAAWGIAAGLRCPGDYLLRFFAGFCLIANGAYIGCGWFTGLGDAGDMLRYGSPPWLLCSFGGLTVAMGLWLWHRQGRHFGLAQVKGQVSAGAAYGSLVAFLALVLSA
jgi:hypothetical protein